MPAARRAEAATALGQFREPRYLHQTVVRDADGHTRFYDDLPLALRSIDGQEPAGEWRVHFHMPIYCDRVFENVQTTRSHIPECVELLKNRVSHWEIETYAWDVLPKPLRQGTLAEGIAAELTWLRDEVAARVEGA